MGGPSRTVDTVHGQITPPEDGWKVECSPLALSDMSSAHAQAQAHAADLSSTTSPPSTSSLSGTTSRSRRPGVDKKDKYREKNRVAAAKCRAKKKEHTDDLEECHRTQSMLNSLLKQTEQNLRDELSLWRTQALQHAYCDCTPVQEYNLRKAKALASDKDFGRSDSAQVLYDASVAGPSMADDSFFAGQPSTSAF